MLFNFFYKMKLIKFPKGLDYINQLRSFEKILKW